MSHSFVTGTGTSYVQYANLSSPFLGLRPPVLTFMEERSLDESTRLLRSNGLERPDGSPTDDGFAVLARILWKEKRKQVAEECRLLEERRASDRMFSVTRDGVVIGTSEQQGLSVKA